MAHLEYFLQDQTSLTPEEVTEMQALMFNLRVENYVLRSIIEFEDATGQEADVLRRQLGIE